MRNEMRTAVTRPSACFHILRFGCALCFSVLRGIEMQAGKTAIVTGSTSGIGLGIATALAGAGTNIVLNGFGGADEIDKIVSDLKRQHNVGVMYSRANIADVDEISEMVEQTRPAFGFVDILVNNAGIQYVAPIEEF